MCVKVTFICTYGPPISQEVHIRSISAILAPRDSPTAKVRPFEVSVQIIQVLYL